jgi:hypothetical protein
MKITKEQIRKKADDLGHRAVALARAGIELFNAQVTSRVLRFADMVKAQFITYPDARERTRRLIILFASIFILDYLMYCLHTDKNVADIFPDIPSLDRVRQVSIYIPGLDGATITRESRSIPVYADDERTARLLFEMVAQGSRLDNTALAVPVDLFVRKVWMFGRGNGKNRVCIVDCEPAELKPDVTVIKNSESLFRRAVEKTIRENIPSVKTVLVLEKGVPGTPLWEL